MVNNLELTRRQASRLLEHALRARAAADLEPRVMDDQTPLKVRFAAREGNMLVFELDTQCAAPAPLGIIGAFCEVRTMLEGEAFLFSTCVLDVVDSSAPPRIMLAVPSLIQVANRRRFERTSASVASAVRLIVDGQLIESVGLMSNISADGLGCSVAAEDFDDLLLLGDAIRVRFEIAGFDDEFEIGAAVCSKTLSKDRTNLALGLEFQVGEGDSAGAESLVNLRRVLLELMTDANRSEDGR